LPGTHDRVFDVHGRSARRELISKLASATLALNDPAAVLVIGQDETVDTFLKHLADSRADLARIARLPERAVAGTSDSPLTVSRNFGSKDDATLISDMIRRGVKNPDGSWSLQPGTIKALVVLDPDDEEDHHRYLHLLLNSCPDVTVYFLWFEIPGEEPSTTGIVADHEVPGFEAIPAAVNFDAPEAEGVQLSSIPAESIVGRLGEVARMTRSPLGYSYLATIAAASVFVSSSSNIRAAIYSALVGAVHQGKSVASERTRKLLGLDDHSPLVIDSTPASDRGLFKLVSGMEFKKRLLAADEGRAMMAKGSIENSTLISLLCALWSRNTEGVADKARVDQACVELSLLLNLKVADESEFPSVFTHYTSHGLYDRFLFGVRGSERWHYTPWDFDPSRDLVKLEPTRPLVPGWVFDRAHLWAGAGEDRDRLAENALRVAYITAACDGLVEVSMEHLEAALSLMNWQEQIRSVFQPAKGANEHQECVNTILDAFKKAPGRAMRWRDAYRAGNWHRRFPRAITGVRKMLERDGVLVFHKDSGKHYLNEVEKEITR